MNTPTTSISVDELINFVIFNRRYRVFKGWTREQISEAIINTSQDGTMLYAIDQNRRVVGIVIAEKFGSKTLYITEILTTEPWVLKQFITHFQLLFQGYALCGHRHNRLVWYNTKKLCSKIEQRNVTIK